MLVPINNGRLYCILTCVYLISIACLKIHFNLGIATTLIYAEIDMQPLKL